jgi:thiol-disulfide isomerase/thioredoxin
MRHDTEQKTTTPPMRRRLLGWGLQLIGLMVVLFLIHLWQTRDSVKGEAPPLLAHTLDGQPIDLMSHKELPVLIHFWSTWCPVCGLEASTIDQLSKDHAVVTVAMQSGQDQEVNNYLQEHELGFSTINDPQGRISSAWRVKGLPTSYIVDKDHKIRFVSVGYTPELTLRLRLWLAEKAW